MAMLMVASRFSMSQPSKKALRLRIRNPNRARSERWCSKIMSVPKNQVIACQSSNLRNLLCVFWTWALMTIFVVRERGLTNAELSRKLSLG